jgi:hypothetical protein
MILRRFSSPTGKGQGAGPVFVSRQVLHEKFCYDSCEFHVELRTCQCLCYSNKYDLDSCEFNAEYGSCACARDSERDTLITKKEKTEEMDPITDSDPIPLYEKEDKFEFIGSYKEYHHKYVRCYEECCSDCE